MANNKAQQDVLRSTTATPIAQLHPKISDPKSRVIAGVITITWPYSVVTKSVAFILAEHDVRLRRDKGQLRVEFRGAAGKALADAGVGGGDEIRLSLDGVEWKAHHVQMNLPGTTLDWQLKFTNRLCLSIRRVEHQDSETIDIDASVNRTRDSPEPVQEMSMTPPAEPEESRHANPLPPTPLSSLCLKRLAPLMLGPGEYASPAFKRARVSYGSLFEDGLDIFKEDEVRKDKKRRKSRFSMNAASWRYNSRSHSPEAEQSSVNDSELDDEPDKGVDVEAAEQSLLTPSRPPMVDQGCQTKDLDFNPYKEAQVAAESRLSGRLLQSTPAPGWRHRNLDSELQHPPALSYHHALGHRQSLPHGLGVVHRDEACMLSGHALDFGLPMNIDPSLEFQSVAAINQHTEHVMIRNADPPRQSDLHEAQRLEGLAWATEGSATIYSTTPMESFGRHPIEMAYSPPHVKRLGTESEDEAPERSSSDGHDFRIHDHAHNDPPEEVGLVSADENEADEHDRYHEEQYDEYSVDNERVTTHRRNLDIQQDESTDNESEEADSEEGDDHRGSGIQEYDGSTEKYSEDDCEYGGNFEEGGDEEDEDGEDESEGSDENEEPPPRPVPQAPKEPIFISLLSDSEEEEDEDADIGDKSKNVNKDAIVNHDGDEQDRINEEGESEEEAVVEDLARVQAAASSPYEQPRALSQLDGCDDEAPNESDRAWAMEKTTDGTAEPNLIACMSNDEAHQIPRQNTEGSSEANPGLNEGAADDDNMVLDSRVLKPVSCIQKEPRNAEQFHKTLVKESRSLSPQDDLKPRSTDPVNLGELAISRLDNKATTADGEEDANSLEAVNSFYPTAESLVSSTNDIATGRVSVDASTKGHIGMILVPPPKESTSQEAPQTIGEAMAEYVMVHEDVEMQDATLDQSTDEPNMLREEQHCASNRASVDVVTKDTETPGLAAPTSPPATQPEYSQTIALTETVAAFARQESARQLPTPGETQQEDETSHLGPAELQLSQDVDDDLAAEQQLMSELQEQYSSSHRKVRDVGPASAASSSFKTASAEEGALSGKHRKNEWQEPGMSITVHSLRSYCRSHRSSIESIATDPGLLVAKASPSGSPTRTHQCLVKDISPHITLRASRSRTDQPDPSVVLAKASGLSSEPDAAKDSDQPAVLRVRRSKNDSSDPSILLARRSPSPSKTTHQKTGSPKLRMAHHRVDQSNQSVGSAAVSPKASRQQDTIQTALQGAQRSKTPELAAGAGETFGSPSVAGSVPEDGSASALKLQLLKSLRAILPDYLPLRSIRNSLTKTTDILAVATSSPPQPHRPKHGPRDYMLELTLTDPSTAPASVNVAHIFRPHQASLPVVRVGDIVLLRRVQVVSMQGRGFGVRAGDASAWAVFEKGDEEMLPQIKGPPVELASEEVEYAQGLKRWWGLLDERALAKIDKASHKVSQAAKDDPK